MKRVLVTGASGQLGKSLQKVSEGITGIEFLWTDFEQMDISNPKEVLKVFRDFKPNYCINCAAYTQVDLAEKETEKARLINAKAVENLILACNESNCCIIHISTDFVFDGNTSNPYIETSQANPINAYGVTKHEGENKVLLEANKFLIIRTSWVFSEFGKNFVKTMINLSAKLSELSVVNDQEGCPTYAVDLARQIIGMIRAGIFKNEIYHYCNQGVTTWNVFAEYIFKLLGVEVEVNPISSEAFGAPAKRPLYSVLDCTKIQKDHGVTIRRWELALEECVRELLENKKV